MPESIQRWSAAPDIQAVRIDAPDLRVRSLSGLDQWTVSGNHEAAFRRADIATPAIGALGVALGSPYAVAVARDRVLLVGDAVLPFEPGWTEDGYLASCMSAAFHVFELDGGRVMDVVRRACAIDPRSPGPSAAVSFAGVTALMYRTAPAGRLRLHVDRGLAPYVWQWLETTCRVLYERDLAPA